MMRKLFILLVICLFGLSLVAGVSAHDDRYDDIPPWAYDDCPDIPSPDWEWNINDIHCSIPTYKDGSAGISICDHMSSNGRIPLEDGAVPL